MSIRDTLQKIKSIDKSTLSDLYVVALIILVGFSAFGLGRLSLSEDAKEPVQIIGASVGGVEMGEATSINPPAGEAGRSGSSDGGELVASKNGSKYHYPWCSGAQRMNEENKIWFDSAEEARKAGYTPAANCKGLK